MNVKLISDNCTILKSSECKMEHSSKCEIKNSHKCIISGSDNCSMDNCTDVIFINCTDLNISGENNKEYRNKSDTHVHYENMLGQAPTPYNTPTTLATPLVQKSGDNEELCDFCDFCRIN